MVGTRRNRPTGSGDGDSDKNKPKKLTKAQLKQLEDIPSSESIDPLDVDSESEDTTRSDSALGKKISKELQEVTENTSPVHVPKRGRPRKNPIIDPQTSKNEPAASDDTPKEQKKRGRPRKSDVQAPVVAHAVEKIKSDETDVGSMSSGSNSNSPANRRISNRLKKKNSDLELSIEAQDDENANTEEALGEEFIEIVVEEHTSSSTASNFDESHEKRSSPLMAASGCPDEYDISEGNSPEIRVEIMEDSNSMQLDDPSNIPAEETSQNEPETKAETEPIEEEEVSIVYLDENDTVLSEDKNEPTEIVSDSDATMDSVDLQTHINFGKGKRTAKKQALQERAFERLKNEFSESPIKMEEIEPSEAIVEEKCEIVEKLEQQVQNIAIEEKVTKEASIESPKPNKMEVEEVTEMKSEEPSASNGDPKSEESSVINEFSASEELPQPEISKIEPKIEEQQPEETVDTKTDPKPANEPTNDDENSTSIRRSRRIKTISTQNRRSVGHGLVKDREKFYKKSSEENSTSTQCTDALKVKSRWRRLSEIEMGVRSEEQTSVDPSIDSGKTKEEMEEELRQERICEERLKHFVTIKDNEYKCDRNISKEAKKMLCDCFLTQEEYDQGELGCGEDCLNRMLMIECGPKCNIGDRCTNKRFQNAEYAKCKVFRTEKKGFGIMAARAIQPNEFIMEYVGEVLDSDQFEKRANAYSNDKNKHYYFMALRSDAVIDATTRGNISRFINHSCDPNAETQKWTVNGELRIGFFSTRFIPAGEEITFDYQFQRYGKEAQKCYCEAANCRGWIGQAPGDDESEAEESDVSEESEASDNEKPEISTEEKERIEQKKAVQKEKKEKAKVQRKKRAYRRKKRQEILDDLDLDDEIDMLCSTGLKNQQQTLKLSRLLVRAKLLEARSKLLTLLKNGELACRRLFLDYHGLRLLHGWMEDSQDTDQERLLKFRILLLEVLNVLPITNKTILKDSKVLSTVQKWASEHDTSPNSSSPNDESSESGSATPMETNDPNKPTTFNADMFKHIPDLIKQSEQLIKTIGVDELKHIIDTCGEIREHVQKEKEEKSKMKQEGGSKDASLVIDETSNQEKATEKCEENEKTTSDTEKQEIKPEILEEMETSQETHKEIVEETPPVTEELSTKDEESTLKEEISESKDEKKDEIKEIPEEIVKIESQLIETVPQVPNIEFKDLKNELCQLAKKLLNAWKDLKESFRIPKKERIEQMKEHEREADLNQTVDTPPSSKKDRYVSRYRDKERERPHETRETTFPKPPKEKTSLLSKEQRRHLFEMKVAQQEHERRQQEIWYCHEQNCLKFGINPRHVAPQDVPAMMNPITGQYYTADRRPLPTPPSHQYMKFVPPPLPTNPIEYDLPPMDLPPMWKFAIDDRGRIYYYHIKIRIPQWKPPIKIQPLSEPNDDDEDDFHLSDEGSESSTTDTCDSEEEELKEKLEILQECKERSKTQFNLDDLLAKPSDMNEDDEDKHLVTIPSIEETNNLIGAQVKADILNSASNFTRSLDAILPNIKRIQRKRSGLVQERSISPRTEEDKRRGQLEMRRYKETKEKLRRRKEEAKRRQIQGGPSAAIADIQTPTDPNIRPKIVDELDILHSSEVKRPSAYEAWKVQEQKIRAEKKRQQQKTDEDRSAKRKKAVEQAALVDLHSEEARRIKDKFRTDIAGVIVHHLKPYMTEECKVGRITNSEDFKHLARKLTHFVMLKELKHCDNTIVHLGVTESVKVKAREFIKKYMSKFDPIYVKPENEQEFRE